METLTIKNQPTPPKQYKAAVYIRVNDPNKLAGATQTKSQPSKTALYCRVASKNTNAEAMQTQLHKLRDFAKQQGYNVCMEYFDDGFPGNNLDRPAFAAMEAAINNGEIDTVIVRSIDRIVRNYILFGEWDDWRRSKGVQLIASDGSHEPPSFLKEIRGLMKRKNRK